MYKPLLHITRRVGPQTTVGMAGLAQSEQVGQAVGKREKCNSSVGCSLIPVSVGMRRAKIRDENRGGIKDEGNAWH